MKNKLIGLLILFVASTANAQEKLSKITSPTSPASYMIGAQPSAVLAPKSFQALETALYSNFLNGDGKTVLPNDFALEFTPYWATDHGLSLKEYLFPSNFWDQLLRNSSFSVASSQNFLLEDKTVTSGLGIGYRTTFFIGDGKDKTKLDALVKSLQAKERFMATIVAALAPVYANVAVTNEKEFLDKAFPIIVAKLKKLYGVIPVAEIQAFSEKLENGLPALANYSSNNDQFQTDFNNLVEKEAKAIQAVKQYNIDTVNAEFKDYITKRLGFSLDVAYGTFVNFPTSKFDYSMVPRQSFWLTPTYNFEGEKTSFLKIMGVLRYEWYDQDYYTRYFPTAKTFKNNFDYGLAVSGDFAKFSVQLEAAGRAQSTEIPDGVNAGGNKTYTKASASDFQCVGTFSYRINKEFAISYSLGDKFETVLNQGKTLVSMLSLNLGFGGPTTNDIKPTK